MLSKQHISLARVQTASTFLFYFKIFFNKEQRCRSNLQLELIKMQLQSIRQGSARQELFYIYSESNNKQTPIDVHFSNFSRSASRFKVTTATPFLLSQQNCVLDCSIPPGSLSEFNWIRRLWHRLVDNASEREKPSARSVHVRWYRVRRGNESLLPKPEEAASYWPAMRLLSVYTIFALSWTLFTSN